MSPSPQSPLLSSGLLELEFPQSLAVYDKYADAQKSVDFLSDKGFPVENLLIVGTELKQVERITGRLTAGKVALAGVLSGLWLGLFVGLVLSIFGTGNTAALLVFAAVMGAVFGGVWAVIGYVATRGRRDFSSVSAVVATKYEVLVEHKHREQARELLAQLPGALPNPFS